MSKKTCLLSILTKSLLVLFIIAPLLLFSQSKDLDPDTKLIDYEIKTWDKIGETPIERVWDIAQDSIGYIWLASDRGLLRFDGSKLEVYNMSNSILDTESVRFVEVGQDNVIWFSTRRGLFYLKDGTVNEYKIDNDKKVSQVSSLYIQQNGSVWFTAMFKLYSINNFDVKEYKHPGLKSWMIFAGKNGKSWITGYMNGVYGIYELLPDEKLKKREVNGEFNGTIYSLSENNSGDLLLGTFNGSVYLLKKNQLQEIDFKKTSRRNFVSGVLLQEDGSIWIGDEFLYKIINGEVDVLSENEGLSANKVRSVFKDKDGNIWVGTISGLNYISNTPFKLIRNNYNSKPIKPKSIIEGDKGSIFGGTIGDGFFILENDELYSTKKIQEIGDTIYTISKTNVFNEFLVGSEKGMFKVQQVDNNFILLDKLENKKVTKILHQKDGVLFYSVYVGFSNSLRKEELYRLKNGIKTRIKNLPKVQFQWMIEDFNRFSLFATNKGIYQVFGDSAKKVFSNGLLDNKFIQGYSIDNKNNIWVSSYGTGLFNLKEDTIINYTTRNGLPVNQAYLTFNSEQSGFWFYRNNKKFGELQKLVPYVDESNNYKIGTGEVFNLIEKTRIGVFTNYPYKLSSKGGAFYLIGVYGLIKFDPNSIDISDPKVLIQNIVSDGKNYLPEEKIVFEPNQKSIQIHYSCIDFVRRESQVYEFILEGLHDRWQPVGHRNIAYFNSLKAGDYNFRVRVKLPSGDYIEAEETLKFTKKEFWYKTNLAYFSYVFLIIIFVVSFFQIRIRTIKYQKLLLQNKVDERTEELRDLNENLENKVLERTEEISNINSILSESEERYRYAMEASEDGIWDYDVLTNKISFSPGIYTMLGYEAYEFPETRAEIYNRLHPEENETKKERCRPTPMSVSRALIASRLSRAE